MMHHSKQRVRFVGKGKDIIRIGPDVQEEDDFTRLGESFKERTYGIMIEDDDLVCMEFNQCYGYWWSFFLYSRSIHTSILNCCSNKMQQLQVE